MIDIYVGESRRHWALHRNLLCHHSELLENELQSEDGKKHKDKLELPDHDPDGFELLVKWLYQGKLDDVSDFADATQKYDYAVNCYKLYLLCERFDMPQLKNVAMDQYRKGLNEAELVPDAEEIDEIYRKSPLGSPFRRLMTRIAARQIMDPDSQKDVETYRQCFDNNPDFAVDLVNAIKLGTGGMLFDDPTDPGNECEYHDHEGGPNCHIKGKGKVKQVLKASAHRPFLKSSKSDHSAIPDQPLLPHHPPRLIPHPQPHPRQARRQDGMGSGPLRRRLTSPASSTVETSTENVTASPPSPKEQRDKFRPVPLPNKKREVTPTLTEDSHTVQDGLHQSSERESHPLQNSQMSDEGNKSDASKKSADHLVSPPRRGIWEWAVGGTGRLGMIGKIPGMEHRAPKTSKAATTAVNGALEGGRPSAPHDDFSIPSETSTSPDDTARLNEAAAAKLEGLGISNSTMDPSLFSQTKRSSDDLVASAQDTPSPPQGNKSEQWTNVGDSMTSTTSNPASPSPPSRNRTNSTNRSPNNTSSPHRIPKYKIALAANILSPARSAAS